MFLIVLHPISTTFILFIFFLIESIIIFIPSSSLILFLLFSFNDRLHNPPKQFIIILKFFSNFFKSFMKIFVPFSSSKLILFSLHAIF
jgi:hypothetical protein